MLDRLSSVEERYEELDRLLSDPAVVGDYTKVQQYAKEQSAMREVVELARKFRNIQLEISELQDIAYRENDVDLVELAKEELEPLLAQVGQAEENLKKALVPKDPNDEKNVIMEIILFTMCFETKSRGGGCRRNPNLRVSLKCE